MKFFKIQVGCCGFVKNVLKRGTKKKKKKKGEPLHAFFPQRPKTMEASSQCSPWNSVCKDCKINPGIKKQINKTLHRVNLKRAVLFSRQKWGFKLVFQKSHKFSICPKWEIIILLNNKLKMNPLLSPYNLVSTYDGAVFVARLQFFS